MSEDIIVVITVELLGVLEGRFYDFEVSFVEVNKVLLLETLFCLVLIVM